jgi:hypothetical protein
LKTFRVSCLMFNAKIQTENNYGKKI